MALYAICSGAVLIGLYDQSIPTRAYGKYGAVVLIAMILEATSRPGALRPTPGRARHMVWQVTRRQWIWIIASMTGLLVFSKDQTISRLFLATFGGLAMIMLYICNRFLLRFLGYIGEKHSKNWRLRTFILGPKDWCESVAPEVEEMHSLLEVRCVEWTDGPDTDESRYLELVAKEPIDLLVMPPRHLEDSTVMGLLRQGDRLGYRCWMPLELTRRYRRRFDLQRVGCLDVLTPPVEPLENTSNQVLKRIFDMAFSAAVVATVLLPLCMVVWVIHRLYSPGPLFFKQDRVGKNGNKFQVYKFRSLHPNNATEATQVTKGDSRIFKGGRMLRKTSIDEIPQFINVLLGDMSVVGPRPHMEEHDFLFREIFERYGVRRYVKPGVTGLAQVKGFRGEVNRPLDLRHRARLDNFYVTHWDIALDFRIVAWTGVSMIKPPKSAY